ncbi:hypothetical protein HAX54_047194 [Datura stramonium]|uniref:Uncharacterized protein n=1 Tax=Datura stramonium TaxID=4076 RepID=A0ABS8Y9R0_DATST|nr:hypothetical protein [Datura stramonium]
MTSSALFRFIFGWYGRDEQRGRKDFEGESRRPLFVGFTGETGQPRCGGLEENKEKGRSATGGCSRWFPAVVTREEWLERRGKRGTGFWFGCYGCGTGRGKVIRRGERRTKEKRWGEGSMVSGVIGRRWWFQPELMVRATGDEEERGRGK